MKIAHLADTHIHRTKYLEEFKEVLKELFQRLREEKVDAIVHAGDIIHDKVSMTPELVKMTSWFLQELAAIAPLYIILGNHDGTIHNLKRENAIAPLVEIIDNDNIHLLEKVETVDIGEGITITSFPIFGDSFAWRLTPEDQEKVNIAVYHGTVSNARTDLGFSMHRSIDYYDKFGDYDYAFLGHIHKAQQVDEEGKAWYAGNTLQTNFGEDSDKGFLVWDIKGKDEFERKFVPLSNPRPFVTINVHSVEDFMIAVEESEEPLIPKNARIKLKIMSPSIVFSEIMDMERLVMEKGAYSVVSPDEFERVTMIEEGENELKSENLSDVAFQSALIRRYLNEKIGIEDETLIDEVVQLNIEYADKENDDAELATKRNVIWKLEKLGWNNMFSFGANNHIDFGGIDPGQTIGIFGQNYSGKSSIIDALLFVLFKKISRSTKSISDIINDRKDFASCYVRFSIGGKFYDIQRTLERTSKGGARTGLEFREISPGGELIKALDKEKSEDGTLKRKDMGDTEKLIQSFIGTYNDFVTSSLETQFGSNRFVNQKSSERITELKRILNAGVFDKRREAASKEFNAIKREYEKRGGRDYVKELTDLQDELQKCKRDQKEDENFISETQEEIKKKQEKQAELSFRIKEYQKNDVKSVNVKVLRKKAKDLVEVSLPQSQAVIVKLKKELKVLEEEQVSANKYLAEADKEGAKGKVEEKLEIDKKIPSLRTNLRVAKENYARDERTVELIARIPCRDHEEMVMSCEFVKDAAKLNGQFEEKKANIKALEEEIAEKKAKSEELRPFQDALDEIAKMEKVALRLESSIATKKAKVEGEKVSVEKIEASIVVAERDISQYEQRKEDIEALNAAIAEKKALDKEIEGLERQERRTRDAINDTIYRSGQREGSIKTTKKEMSAAQKIEREMVVYEYFLRCIHGKQGIPYDLIKKWVPVINHEISNILGGSFDFRVFFDNSDLDNLEIYLQHNHDRKPRFVEMGSGAEKSIASKAIRLALLSVTSIPRTNVFIMDEPGTAFDKDHLFDFRKLLEIVKNKFGSVFLITHIDDLKDIADVVSDVQKAANGDSYITLS